MAQDINISVKVDTSQAQQQTENYKKRLKDLKDEMTALQIETDGLSKASAEQRKRFSELEQEAGKIQDAMGDTAQRVKNLSDDYKGMTTALEGIGGAVGGITAVQGAISLLGGDSDIAAESIKKITSLMGILQGIQNVQKVLNKDSATMTALLALKNKLLTTSIKEETTAQMALNAAQLGMAAAVVAVVAAVGGLIYAYAKAKNSVSALNRELESKANESIAETASQVLMLKEGWDKLGDSLDERKKYIEDNAEAIGNLGLRFNDVNEAEEFFRNNTDKYIEAQKQRAKAAAAAEMASELFKQQLKNAADLEAMVGENAGGFKKLIGILNGGKESLTQLNDAMDAGIQKQIDALFNLKKTAEDTAKSIESTIVGLETPEQKKAREDSEKEADDYLKSVEEKYKLSAANIKKEYFDILNSGTASASEKYQAAKKMEGELIDAQILKYENENKAIGKNTSQYAENELKLKELRQSRADLYAVTVDETTEEEELEAAASNVNDALGKQASILADDLVPAADLFKDKLVEIDEEENRYLKSLEENAEKERKIRTASWDIASNAANAYLDLVNANMESELEAAEGNEEEQARIRKKYAKQQFIGQIASIASSAAKAIMEAWEAYGAIPGAGPVLAAAQTAVIGATAMAQTMAAQTAMNTAMKAARGGILNGQSHANGGIMLSNGVEAEGGEAIINKRSTAAFAPLLSEINSYNGYGAPLIRSNSSAAAALGGGVSDEAIRKIVSATVAGVTAIPVVVSEHSITEAQRTVGITRERSFI